MMMNDVPGEEYMLQNYNKGRGIINKRTIQNFKEGGYSREESVAKVTVESDSD